MATEKVLKLTIEGEGFEPVYKNLDKIKDKSKDTLYNFKEISEAFKHVLNPATDSLKTLDQVMVASVKHIIPDMERINQLNRKMAKSDLETNVLKMKNVQAEITALGDKKTSMTKLYEFYDKEEKKILEKGKKRQKEQLKGIDELIVRNKAANIDVTELESKRAEFIKNSDDATLQAVKENYEKRKEAMTAVAKETISTMGHAYEKQKALILEAAELEKQKARTTYDTAIEQAKSIEERVALEKSKAERIEAIDEDMNNKLTENSKTQLSTTTTFIDNAITEITAKVAENKKNGGITDIALTKENITAAKTQLAEYKKILEKSRLDAELYFAALETLNKNDADNLKQVQNEKKNTMAMYAVEIAKIEKTTTEVSKKENGLRIQQLKDYVDVSQKTIKELSEKNKKFKEEFGKGADWLADQFIPKVEDIDNEIKKLDEEQANVAKNREGYSAELQMLRYKQADSSKQMTDYEIEQLKKLEQAEKDNLAKEKEIEKQKEKEQKKKEKAERDRKKIELGRKIVEATADVAAAVTKALTAGPFIGQAIAAIHAAIGAAQIVKMTAQLAKLEDGGMLNGKRHSQGGMRIEGTNIEVEGGEYVVNRESTSKNLGLVRYINSQRKELSAADMTGFFAKTSQGYEPPFRRQFESGGQVPAIEPNSSIDNEALIDAIKSIKIAPKVAVTDIIRAQDEVVHVDGWSGI
ncbi:hypothetical protein [Prevotella sp. 10(H)]|uniref:hypothetical protein n=1 Tax=Prevotella sp. 10(H) TaxID=1158294 RepID=UPI0004A73313|nr:hypothetical protein [Prevotella sp. 10(H)]